MKPDIQIVHDDADLRHTIASCPSCGAPAADKYCSRCGESMAAHAPSAGEFLHEFIGHYVALEGKLWQTLRLLVFKPGQLTVDYCRGRRVPYINPLRLYLTLSLVVFALIKIVGVDLPHVTLDDEWAGMSYFHQSADAGKSGNSPYVKLSIQVADEEDRTAVRGLFAQTASLNPRWAENGQRFMDRPDQEKALILNNGFLTYLPYMLIGALPLFALYLKLMFRHPAHRYGEHMVFAMHVTAFAFLLIIAMIGIPGNLAWLLALLYSGELAHASIWDYLQFLPLFWIMAYLPAAMRRVYGGNAWSAWLGSLVLMTVHVLVIVSLIVGAQIVAILQHG